MWQWRMLTLRGWTPLLWTHCITSASKLELANCTPSSVPLALGRYIYIPLYDDKYDKSCFNENVSFFISRYTLLLYFQSSFLQVILDELKPSYGHVHVNGKISYASQEAWLFTGSVRSNILFGQTYDKDRYQKVVKVCALIKDFEQLPYGDKTLVGDRGTALSGGQRARINLAR